MAFPFCSCPARTATSSAAPVTVATKSVSTSEKEEPSMAITKVWIEPGCILCSMSVAACSAVFEIIDDAESSRVKPDVDFTQHEAEIKEAAEGCPVDVIKYEEA